jgi:hypothetical protein
MGTFNTHWNKCTWKERGKGHIVSLFYEIFRNIHAFPSQSCASLKSHWDINPFQHFTTAFSQLPGLRRSRSAVLPNRNSIAGLCWNDLVMLMRRSYIHTEDSSRYWCYILCSTIDSTYGCPQHFFGFLEYSNFHSSSVNSFPMSLTL